MSDMSRPASAFDTSVAHPARRYNYWLDGKDNFAADRKSGDAIAAAFPSIRHAVRENRRFLRRAMEFLAGEAGSLGRTNPWSNIVAVSGRRNAVRVIAPPLIPSARAWLPSPRP